jgi:hypothetical protein
MVLISATVLDWLDARQSYVAPRDATARSAKQILATSPDASASGSSVTL